MNWTDHLDELEVIIDIWKRKKDKVALRFLERRLQALIRRINS